MQSGHYTIEFKYGVLRDMFENRFPLQETEMQYGISIPCTVLIWKRKYDRNGLNDGSRIWSANMVKEDDIAFYDNMHNRELYTGEKEKK